MDGASAIDEATAAQAVLPGQPVIAQVITDDPPSARGGVSLVDGNYDLVATKIYIGPSGDPSTVPTTITTERVILDGGQLKSTATRNGVTTTEVASLTFCGAGLGLTYTSGPRAGTTAALSFNANGDTLEIFNQNTVSTYTLRAGSSTGVEHAAIGAACKQAAGVCGGLAHNGTWVVEQTAIATAPVGVGGSVLLNRPYRMISDVYYNGAPPNGSRDKITLIMHPDTTFEFVEDIDHQGALRLSGTYTTVGNALTFNITCSPFGGFPLPFTYNAHDDVLQTIQPGGANHDTGTECMTYRALQIPAAR
jgi:hypothetical protein